MAKNKENASPEGKKLFKMGIDFEQLVAKYRLAEGEKSNGNGNGNGNGSGKVAASKEAATVGGRISNN